MPAASNTGSSTAAITPGNATIVNAANGGTPVAVAGPGTLVLPVEPAVPPGLIPGPLSPAALLSVLHADTVAPIAFALRLDEAIYGQQTAADQRLAQQLESLAPPSAQTIATTEAPRSQSSEFLTTSPAPTSSPNAVTSRPKVAAGPSVAAAPDKGLSEPAIQDAQEISKPARSQSSPDDGSKKHQEEISALPRPHIVTADVTGDVRAEPDLTSDAGPKKANGADALPNPPQGAEVRDTSAILRPQPPREISMRLTPAESSAVDITLFDRAGSVHVAVRTADSDLAHNLQSGLGDLVHRLQHKGFEAEAWSPGDTSGSKPASSMQSNGNDSASQRHGRDPRGEAQQDNSGQQNQGRNRPKWVAELEQRLASADRGHIEREE